MESKIIAIEKRCRYCKIASIIITVLYAMMYFADMAVCLAYKHNYKNDLGEILAYVALTLTCLLFLNPSVIINTVLSILAIYPRGYKERGKGIVWAIISPFIYITFCISAIVMFVLTTGGV